MSARDHTVLPATHTRTTSAFTPQPQSITTPSFLQCFDTVGLVIWPVIIVPEMTYNMSSGTLSLYTIYLDINFICLPPPNRGLVLVVT